jgi:hypothetical protein
VDRVVERPLVGGWYSSGGRYTKRKAKLYCGGCPLYLVEIIVEIQYRRLQVLVAEEHLYLADIQAAV